jgi:outer membrane protein assembly factor BamB
MPDRTAICHRGLVYSVAHDDRTVQALDATTGAIAWRQTLPGSLRHVAGVRAGVVAVAGAELWGLDVDSGNVRWRFGFHDVEGEFIGQGSIAGDCLYACTREELWEIDLATGAPTRRVPLREGYGMRGGHVVNAGDRLLIAAHEELAAFAFGSAASAPGAGSPSGDGPGPPADPSGAASGR